MHKFEMPEAYVERVTERQGRPHTCESFDGPKTALVVVALLLLAGCQEDLALEDRVFACDTDGQRLSGMIWRRRQSETTSTFRTAA